MARKAARTKTAERTARYRQRLAERHVPEAAAVDAALLAALAHEARAVAERSAAGAEGAKLSEIDRAVGEMVVRIMTGASEKLVSAGFDSEASKRRVMRRLRRPPQRRQTVPLIAEN